MGTDPTLVVRLKSTFHEKTPYLLAVCAFELTGKPSCLVVLTLSKNNLFSVALICTQSHQIRSKLGESTRGGSPRQGKYLITRYQVWG